MTSVPLVTKTKCIVCRKKFDRLIKKRRGGREDCSCRARNCITCSKQCSNEYRKIRKSLKIWQVRIRDSNKSESKRLD